MGGFNSRITGAGVTGERVGMGGVLISLTSSSESEFGAGESFFFSS